MTDFSTPQISAIFSKVGMVLSGYQAGFELVQGMQPDAIENFTVISSGGVPRLLLPPTRPMMRTALSSFLGGRSSAELAPAFVQLAAKAGGPFSRFSSNVSLMSHSGGPAPLRELVSDVIGRNDFQLALRVSFGRPNAKTVAMAISDSGEVLCFVKLGSEAMTNKLVAHEGEVLKHLESLDVPLITPARLYSDTWADDQSVLITAPLQLEPLNHDAPEVHAAADALALRTKVSSSPLADSDYWHNLTERVGEFENAEALQTMLTDIERIWGADEFDFGVSHGDWTRANVGMVDGHVAAIDWERCTKDYPAGIDTAHFAIFEQTSRAFNKSINIDQVAGNVAKYLESGDTPPAKARSLVAFALLEMVVRFKSAENAGLRSKDSKFGPALKEGLRKWA